MQMEAQEMAPAAFYGFENGGPSAGSALVSGFESSSLHHSKSHPRLLKSNATSHVWAFGALAELLDNAQDAEASSKTLWVDVVDVNVRTPSGERVDAHAITVTDDGMGMRKSQVHSMLSYGFSSKEHAAGNVGR